ncbi:MAG: outer membrane lipoprotein-sorting protein [Acidobacteriota bacterium]|nr:outer membrane lipoprotein-sorting protein [Acidobacteriota bacterium]
MPLTAWTPILALVIACALHADPPPDLIKRIVARETETAQAQANYTYRQTLTIEEFDDHNVPTGRYREIRDVVFTPKGARTEEFVGKPDKTLKRLILTDEDFRDVREVQPFLMTAEQAFLYETRFKGEETMDGVECWVVQIQPRQLLSGQRLFEGMLWVSQADYSILRSEGQAVPQIHSTKSENLFPHFTTIRKKIAGGLWFPVVTFADDTLYFRTGPQRIRMTIRYAAYKKFGADSKITFEPPAEPPRSDFRIE